MTQAGENQSIAIPATVSTPACAEPLPARILVVDDSEGNRKLLTLQLRRLGYTVASAGDGPEALDLLNSEPFDLVLLDVVMPSMSGLEVLESVRRGTSLADLPIVMVTALDESKDLARALAMGANDYITKPIDLMVALARIRVHLSLRRSMQQVKELEQELRQRNDELQSANNMLIESADRTRRELDLAALVQKESLPNSIPHTPGLKFAWAFRPCEQLAGDALNICPLAPGLVGIYVLDVAGHGVAASLLSVAATLALSPGSNSMLLRPGDNTPVPPAEVADQLNQKFPFSAVTMRFLTFFYAIVNAPKRELTYVCAGHPGALHLQRAAFLDHRGPPIGFGKAYEQHTVSLEPGDRIYFYSDGVTEAMSAVGQHFGKERLLEKLAEWSGDDLETGVSKLVTELSQWRGGLPLEDDVSIVALECE